MKSGIDAQAQVISGEDPVQLEALLAEHQERFDASVPERRMLVETLVVCEYPCRRPNRPARTISVTGVYQDRHGCWTEGLLSPGILRGGLRFRRRSTSG
jgi:hypothetical protein